MIDRRAGAALRNPPRGAWKKYLEENFFDDAFQRSGDFARFIDEFTEHVRPILTDAGVKVYR